MFPIDLNISKDKKVSFKTAMQLSKWCSKELENWLPINDVQLAFHGNLYSEIQSPISRIQTALTNYETSPENTSYQQELRNWVTNLSQTILNQTYIFSGSMLGLHILSAAPKDRELCAAAYFMAIQPQTSNQNFTKLTALASSYLAMYYLGVSPDTAQAAVKLVESSAAAIEEKKTEIDTLAHNVTQRLQGVEKATESRLARVFSLVGRQINSKRSTYNKRRDETVKELLKYVERETELSKRKIDEFENFTKDKIALQGPIHYWQTKMKIHRGAAVISGILLVIYSVTLFCYTKGYLTAEYGSITGFVNSWKDASLPAIALLGAFFALFLIFARVIYRIFTSQMHLWNDSAERVTMTETYLSLAERGHAREELLGALFARLFAPASDGIVRDDLGAVSPFDALSRTLGGK